MSYDAVLFDLDGVLVTGYETTPEVYRQATDRLLHAFGQDSSRGWTEALENPSSGDAFRTACAQWDINPDAAWGYRERAASELEGERIRARKRAPFEDTNVIKPLSQRLAIGICSNNRHQTVADCLEAFNWEQDIQAFRGRFPTLADFDRRKPNPRYLRWIIDRMDVETPLFVGDRLSDIRTAAAVGCDAALLTRDGDQPDGATTATYNIQSLNELPSLPEIA